MGKTIGKVLVSAAFGLIVAVFVWITSGLFQAAGVADFLRILCDGFFVAAALLLGSGGLVWTYNGGVFDGLGFSVKTIFDRMHRDYAERRQTFMEYREKREAKSSSPRYLLLGGLIHLGLAIVVFLVYQASV